MLPTLRRVVVDGTCREYGDLRHRCTATLAVPRPVNQQSGWLCGQQGRSHPVGTVAVDHNGPRGAGQRPYVRGVFRNHDPEFVRRYENLTPLARMASEEDLVGSVLFLASDLARYVTGHNLVVDRGFSVR